MCDPEIELANDIDNTFTKELRVRWKWVHALRRALI